MSPRHSYKLALRAKGIRPIPPYRQLRSAGKGAQIIGNPALDRRNVGEQSWEK